MSVQKFADYLNAASKASSEFSCVLDIIARFESLACVHASLLKRQEKTTRAINTLRHEMMEYKRKQSAKILVSLM